MSACSTLLVLMVSHWFRMTASFALKVLGWTEIPAYPSYNEIQPTAQLEDCATPAL